MKNNVIRAMAVGLTALMIASSINMTAFADEKPEASTAEASNPQDVEQVINPPALVDEVPPQTPVEEANSDEKEIVEDLEKLDENYNLDNEDEDDERIQVIAGVPQGPGQDENFPAGSSFERDKVDENGDIVKDENGEPVKEEVTFAEAGNEILEDSEAAGEEIKSAKENMETNVQAATDMDTHQKAADDAVGKAENATTEATNAVNKASEDVDTAVTAVESGTPAEATIAVNNARTSVEAAKDTLDKKQEEFGKAKEELASSIDSFNVATEGYRRSKEEAATDLAQATEKLSAAELKLAKLETEVKKAQEEYAKSSAAKLLEAKNKADGSWNPMDYTDNVKAIIQYSILDGKEVKSIKLAPEYKDAVYEVVYVGEDGEETTTKYGLGFKDDWTLDIFETEKKFEYEIPNPYYNPLYDIRETITISKTESDMQQMVEKHQAVKRYEIRDWWGNVTYKTENQLTSWEKNANIPFTYVVTKYTGTHVEPLEWENREIITEWGKINGYFDEYGNYVEEIVNKTTKDHIITVNGIPAIYGSGKVDDAKSEEELSDAAEADFDEKLQEKLADIKKNGIWVFDIYGNTVFIPPHKIVDVTSDTKLENVNYIWTVDGKYVPLYSKDSYCFCGGYEDIEKTETFDVDEEFLSNNKIVLGNKTDDTLKAEITAAYNAEHPDRYVKDVRITHNPTKVWNKYSWCWFTVDYLTISVDYINTYDIDIDDKFDSMEDALEGVEDYAIEKQEGRDSHEKFVSGHWEFDGFIPIWVSEYETVYDDEVTGAVTEGDHAAKIVLNGSYTYCQGYQATIKHRIEDTQKTIIAYCSKATNEIFRKTISVFDKDKYDESIAEAEKQIKSYNDLLDQIADAKDEIDTTKEEIETINDKIAELEKNKASEDIISAWETKLEEAEGKLKEATENYDTVNEKLATVEQALRDRIARENPPSGGGTTGGTTPAIPANIVTTSIVPTVIPEAQVPLATPTRTVRRARAAEPAEEVTVEDEAAPAAAETVEEAEDEKEEATTIAEDATPLSGGEEKSLLARTWWALVLLIIAAVGGTAAYTKKAMKKIR